MSFFQSDYKLSPTGNKNYLKLSDKPTTIRILSSPLIWWLDWDKKWEKAKPVRTKTKQPQLWESYPKEFWALTVYNYNEKCVQVWEITQRSIKEAIIALNDGSRGDPKEFDIEVIKRGKDLETSYWLQPASSGKIALTEEVMKVIAETPVNLEALFYNGDPFLDENKFTDWTELPY